MAPQPVRVRLPPKRKSLVQSLYRPPLPTIRRDIRVTADLGKSEQCLSIGHIRSHDLDIFPIAIDVCVVGC